MFLLCCDFITGLLICLNKPFSLKQQQTRPVSEYLESGTASATGTEDRDTPGSPSLLCAIIRRSLESPGIVRRLHRQENRGLWSRSNSPGASGLLCSRKRSPVTSRDIKVTSQRQKRDTPSQSLSTCPVCPTLPGSQQ